MESCSFRTHAFAQSGDFAREGAEVRPRPSMVEDGSRLLIRLRRIVGSNPTSGARFWVSSSGWIQRQHFLWNPKPPRGFADRFEYFDTQVGRLHHQTVELRESSPNMRAGRARVCTRNVVA